MALGFVWVIYLKDLLWSGYRTLCPFGGHQNAALCNACAVSADIAAVWTQFCIETLICILTGKNLVLVLLLIF